MAFLKLKTNDDAWQLLVRVGVHQDEEEEEEDIPPLPVVSRDALLGEGVRGVHWSSDEAAGQSKVVTGRERKLRMTRQRTDCKLLTASTIKGQSEDCTHTIKGQSENGIQ